jgi:Zn-dependent protease
MFTPDRITFGLMQLVVLILSLSVHEAAHAAAAAWRGDPTARDAGRRTLNPLAHIDPLGTLVMPLLAIFANAPVLGWAKPVPVDLSRVGSRRFDGLLISLAGPFSNFVMCAIAIVVAVAIGS